jgi:hypothetical protein
LPPSFGISGDSARRHQDFLHGFGVGVVPLVTGRMLNPHAVELDVGSSLAVIRAPDLSDVGAGDVEPLVPAKAWRERDQVVQVFHAAREHVEQIGRDDRLLAGVAGVDQR